MANGGTGGLLGNTWITAGPGTVTNTPGRLSIISNNVTNTSAAQAATVRPGQPHRFTYTGEERTFSHKIGKAQEGAEYRPTSGGVLGNNVFEFTPDTATVWFQFQRQSNNTATANDLRLVDLNPVKGSARSLNGTNQYFTMDNQTYGFPMANTNFYIGGWWSFDSLPANSGLYIYDFGRLTGDLGVGRVRLVYDIPGNRLLASSQGSAGGSYRQNYLTAPAITAGVPVYLGIACRSDGDVFPIIGTRRTGGVVSGTIPALQSDLGHHIRIGAKVATAASDFANGSVWDLIWHTGVPSDTVLNALAGGQRPHQISGFTPTYHWPMVASSTKDEESITGLATLRQVGSPAAVAAPVEPEPIAFRSPCFII